MLSDLSIPKLGRATLFLGCVVGILLPSALAFVSYGGRMWVDVPGPESFVVLSTLLVFSILAVRWPEKFGNMVFLATHAVFFVIAKLSFVLSFTKQPETDAAILWRLAGVVADGGVEALAREDAYSLILAPRIFPYLLPLRLLWGPEPSSYTVVNALATVLTSIVVFVFTRDHFGSRAARLAFVLSLLAVDPFLHALVPAHDLPGGLFTLSALFLYSRVDAALESERRRAALGTSIAFGILVFLANLQRDLGLFILLACFGVAVVSKRGRRRAVPYVLLPLVVLGVLGAGLRLCDIPSRDRSGYASLTILGFTDSWGDGTWHYYYHDYWLKGYLPRHLAAEWQPLPGEAAPPEVLEPEFLARKLVSDLYYNPGERVRNYLRKALTLFRFESLDDWYLLGALDRDGVERVTRLRVVYAVPFLGLFVLGGLRIWPEARLFAVLPLVYLAVFCGAMILLSEVQSRYLYQIWFIGPIYIGALIDGALPSEIRRGGSALRPGASNGSPPP